MDGAKSDLALVVGIELIVKSGHYWVYVLFSYKDNKFYVGMTIDLKRRIAEHVSGNVISTHRRRPLKLIHNEYFIYQEDARAREVFLKSGYGREQLRQILKNTLKATLDRGF